MESDKSLKRELGSLCYLYLCGSVLASLPFTQEVVGSNAIFYKILE